MIPIQVLGTGLIPRIGVLAPRLEPFKADRTLIATIMSTPGLTVNFVNPETNATTKLTRQNMDRIIAKWSGYGTKKTTAQKDANHDQKSAADLGVNTGSPANFGNSTPPSPPTPPAPPVKEAEKTEPATEKKDPASTTTGAEKPAEKAEEAKGEPAKEEPKEESKDEQKTDEKGAASTQPNHQQNQNQNKGNTFKTVINDSKKK